MSHILFSVVYHPPNAISHVTSSHIVENVDAVVRQHPYTGVMIMGDFNKMADKQLRDLGLKQIVKVATRKSATLDKMYTNISEWYQQPSTLPSISSDHESVILLMESAMANIKPGSATWRKCEATTETARHN